MLSSPRAEHTPSKVSANDAPSAVTASHILVKHRGSRNPRSWKEPEVTRTEEEAIQLIRKFEAQLKQSANLKADFAALAAEESHCGSHGRQGNLGEFGRGKMQKPFEEAAFALQPGQMSSIVKTDSGIHLILRTA